MKCPYCKDFKGNPNVKGYSVKAQLRRHIEVNHFEGGAKHEVGDKVKLREDVLVRHARSVPAHAGYTKEQFRWREVLDKYAGKTGTVTRVFDSGHINLEFKDGTLIGIDNTELVKISRGRPKKERITRQSGGVVITPKRPRLPR